MKTKLIFLLLFLSLNILTSCEEAEDLMALQQQKQQQPQQNSPVNQQYQYTCPENYIFDESGINCCLDFNQNNLCDDTETLKNNQVGISSDPSRIVAQQELKEIQNKAKQEKIQATLWQGPLPDQTYCGNKEIDPYEKCDPSIFGQETCRSDCLGYEDIIFEEDLAQNPSEKHVNKQETTQHQNNQQQSSFSVPTPQNKGTCDLSNFGLTGTTYYYCDCQKGADADCQAGNDANEGGNTNPNNPAKSANLAYSRFNQLQAGEIIAFCKGGSFTLGEKQLYNSNCQVNKRCGFLDYTPNWASGDEQRPLITSSANGISFENPGDSMQDGGYVISGIHFNGKSNTNSFGIFVYNDADNIHMCNLRIEDFAGAVNIAGANQIASGELGNGVSDSIELYNSEIVNNAEQGWLGACKNCVVSNNFFDNNGFKASAGAVFSHSIYAGGSSLNMQITNNEIYRSVHANGKGCQGTIIVAHGQHDGLIIEGNKIVEEQGTAFNSCWGIGITKAYNTPEFFRNIKIQNNVIEYVGNTPITAPDCENCIVSNNDIKHNSQFADS